MATNYNAPGSNDYSSADAIIAALKGSSAASIDWTDPTTALWIKAVAAAGYSRGVAGCPSQEVAEFAYAVLGA